jgi:hypothetical protein
MSFTVLDTLEVIASIPVAPIVDAMTCGLGKSSAGAFVTWFVNVVQTPLDRSPGLPLRSKNPSSYVALLERE